MIKLLDIRYIGWVKRLPIKLDAANAWSDGGWKVLLTKSALYQYFGLSEKPNESVTLYNTLGIQPTADTSEVKTAYWRLAKQWHPDVCKEKDARQQFDSIKAAYDVLGNSIKRAKYDAGLALETSLITDYSQRTHKENPLQIYRSPLRCGYVLCEGSERFNKFVVEKILRWEDIVNARGQTLVTTWKFGDDHYTEVWS